MGEMYVTSDLHLGHENIIKFENRPFSSVKEMNEALVENWNSVVKPYDKVWFLGDLYFKNPEFIPLLNGHKYITLGNHDSGKDQNILRNFDKIEICAKFREMGLLLSHIPVHENELIGFNGEVYKNVHGHIHGKSYHNSSYINVSVERTNYRPIHIEDIRDGKFYDEIAEGF